MPEFKVGDIVIVDEKGFEKIYGKPSIYFSPIYHPGISTFKVVTINEYIIVLDVFSCKNKEEPRRFDRGLLLNPTAFKLVNENTISEYFEGKASKLEFDDYLLRELGAINGR